MRAAMMIRQDPIMRTCPESEILDEYLSLDDKMLLELGCGRAELTREIATQGHGRRMLALEVDEIQHAHNLKITDLPNVQFALAGAQDIPAADASVDVVFMFKSLHHVPLDLMDRALGEIHRVLRPGGYAYVSEPIFAGDFNEVLRLFHDEQQVREAAFAAVKRAVDAGLFELADEIFFNTPVFFEDFAQFEARVLGATHTEHRLSPELYEQVKARFEANLSESGANFSMPMRIDLLRKP